MTYGEHIPVHVVTGFLGSGKTSMMQRLLGMPALADTAVLVNEFGEIGLDHHLLQSATTPTLLMDNGCLCCAIRGDLNDALQSLFAQRERGEIPAFKRVVIETSGLADPAPIAYTVLAEPILQHHFRLGKIVTVVDTVNGLHQLDTYDESVKQVAVADSVVLTKTDIADDDQADRLPSLQARLRRLNLSCGVVDAAREPLRPDVLFADTANSTRAAERDLNFWAASEPASAVMDHHHTEGVTSFAVVVEQALDWTAFGIWMTMLLNRHGDKVLRIKGLLNVAGVATPVLINGVQHIVHPPVHLDEWPDTDHRSRLIFIVDGLEQKRIEASLRAFNGLATAS